MLDSYTQNKFNTNNTYNYNINAVSGTIRKSHPKSIITKASLENSLLDLVNPKYTLTPPYGSSKDYPVIVLQVMLCGDKQCIIEFVKKEDFETIDCSNEVR